MIRSLTPPSAGQPISASFFAELLREIRANRPLQGQNTRVQRTPNGTHISAVASASSSSSRLPGLFEAKLETSDQGGKKVKFEYPYYMLGTRLYRCEDKDVVLQAGKGIYCLSVDLSATEPKGVIEIYEDFGHVQEAAASPTVSIKPLYEFGDQGTPIRDFRNMPTVSTQEFAV